MKANKRVLISIAIILGIIALALVITFVVIFAKGPRDYNEDGSILNVKNMNEVRVVLGDNAIYLRDDFVEDYNRASSSHSCGVHFEGNLNYGELQNIPIKYNKKADGYRVFFDQPKKVVNEDITFVELIIDYHRHPISHDTMTEEYTKSSTQHRALQGQGMSKISVKIENKYGILEFEAQLDVSDNVQDAEFDVFADMLIREYENAVI